MQKYDYAGDEAIARVMTSAVALSGVMPPAGSMAKPLLFV